MRVLIENGRVIDPHNGIDAIQPLCLEAGLIAAVGSIPAGFKPELRIDAAGQCVCPGLVDVRVNLREPGFKDKGGIASETAAAVAGGITSLCCPPDTRPVIDSPSVVEWIHQRAGQVANAKVYLLGALTQGLGQDQLSNMWALKQAGCVGISNGYQALNTEVMRRSCEYAASQGLKVHLHCEDLFLSGNGVMHEGKVSVRLGLPGIPEFAEIVAVTRDLQLIELTGVQAHINHLSTSRAVKAIARAQFDGLPVTADVGISHLFLTEMDVIDFNTNCHLRPPLRTQRDRDGLRYGLQYGTVSVISSDHQPHDADAKLAPFQSSEAGVSAVDVLLPLSLRLVDEGVLSLSQVLATLTCNPAKVLSIPAGDLSPGRAADVCIFDPDWNWTVHPAELKSKGKNSPFLGWELKGRVTATFVNGKLVYKNGK